MAFTYTEEDLGPLDRGPTCCGCGHFFVHDEGPNFCIFVVNGVRVKAFIEDNDNEWHGAFKNGCFIKNRNLHKLPQAARGAVVMFNPVPSNNTCPSKIVPGTIY